MIRQSRVVDAAVARLEIGLAACGASACAALRVVVEQEDRLEVARAPRGAARSAALLRRLVRALVRQDDAALVRLDADEPDEALARVALRRRGPSYSSRIHQSAGSCSATSTPLACHSRHVARPRPRASPGRSAATTLYGLRSR